MPTDKRIFVNSQADSWKGGMDKNNSERYIQNGHYSNARNVSFMVNGDRFTLTNLKGNTEVVYTLQSGDNLCIGAHDDKKNETVYYFMWNGNNNHQILRYQYSKSVVEVTELSYGSGLNFEFDSLITGIEVVQDRFLVWTDNLNEIGCIDLDNYGSLTSPITASDRWEVELGKIAPLEPLEVMWVTDENIRQNSLHGKMYQFCSRYVFEGNLRTPPSTFSKVPVPDLDYLEGGNEYFDNTIAVEVPKPDYDQVTKVELFVRYETDDSTKDAQLWYKFGEIDYDKFSAQDSLTFAFTGTEALVPQDSTEFTSEVTFFPKKCKELVFLPSNVLAFLNFTESFDIDVDVAVEAFPTYNTRPTTAPAATTTLTYANANTPSSGVLYNPKYNIELDVDDYDTLTIGGTPKVGDTIKFTLQVDYTDTGGGTLPITVPHSETFYYVYITKTEDVTGGTVTNRARVAEKVMRMINSIDSRYENFGGVVATRSGAEIRLNQGHNELNTPYEVTSKIGTFVDSTTIAYPTAGLEWLKFRAEKTFKRNALHPFAIQYRDAKGRRSSAIPIGEMFVESQDATTNDDWTSCQLTIGHLAPSWAEYYDILYAKNQTYDSWLQIATTMRQDPDATGTTTIWRSNVYTSTDNFQALFADEDSTSPAYEYNYVDGDRVRLLGRIVAGVTTLFSSQIDIPINRDDTSGVFMKYDLTTLTPALADGETALVEVYRPNRESTRVYYEIGYTGTIDSNRYHSGNENNQSATNGAKVDLSGFGDCYQSFVPQFAPINNSPFYENENESPLYKSAVTDTGRANVESESTDEVVRDTGVTYTQPIVADTSLNGLSVLLGTSLAVYDKKYGSIQKAIIRYGKQLEVYFEDKVGQVGILEELNKSAGGDITYQTAALFNGINYHPYDGGIGTVPESLAVYDQTHYFTCPKNNAICRLGNNGITEISKWGMTKWFNDNLDVKGTLLTGIKAIGAFDERNQAYVISLGSYVELNIAIHPTLGVLVTLPNGFVTADEYAIKVGDTVITTTSTNGYVLEVSGVSRQSDDTAYITWAGGTPAYADVLDCTFKSEIETLWFSEEANAWLSFLDFQPEMMVTCGVDFISFKDGAAWSHNSNDTRGSFYGTAFDAEVTVPFNTPPDVQKRFETIEQEANSVWKSDTHGDIVTLSGQTSLLEEAFYTEFQQGEWAAALRKDSSSPNQTYPLLNGYDLRDRVISIRFVNDNTTRATLEAVALSFSISETSN